jgi:hypothetical protein
MFAGIGASNGVLHFARRAQDLASLRALLALGAPAGRAIPVFSLLVLGSGIYMVEDVWKWDTPWIYVSLIVYIVLFAMGPLVNARRMEAIGMEAGQAVDGAITTSLREKLDDPILTTSERTMTLATIGLIYLMATKPGLTGSLTAVAVFVAVGLLLSAPAWRGRLTQRAQQQAAR